MLCDWLPPDFGAVGQYAVAYGGDLARAGHQVTLVGFSSTGHSELTDEFGAGRLTVRRLRRRPYDKTSTRRRAMWTLGANTALMWHARREFFRVDEICFTGSPPYLLHFVMPVAWLFHRPTRYRISDFHPECLMAEFARVPWWLRLIHRITLFWRRRVGIIEVLGDDQRQLVLAQGIAADRIELRRDPSPVSFTVGQRPAPVPAPLCGRKVLLYSGNWGVAHDPDTLVQGMAQFESQRPGAIGLWLNATGSRVGAVERALRSSGVAVARTQPVPLEQLAAVLLAADLHVICLRDPFVGYVLPSKVYACIESRRPILFVGSQRSDVHLLCTTAANQGLLRYRRVDVGNARGVSDAINALLPLASVSIARSGIS